VGDQALRIFSGDLKSRKRRHGSQDGGFLQGESLGGRKGGNIKTCRSKGPLPKPEISRKKNHLKGGVGRKERGCQTRGAEGRNVPLNRAKVGGNFQSASHVVFEKDRTMINGSKSDWVKTVRGTRVTRRGKQRGPKKGKGRKKKRRKKKNSLLLSRGLDRADRKWKRSSVLAQGGVPLKESRAPTRVCKGKNSRKAQDKKNGLWDRGPRRGRKRV